MSDLSVNFGFGGAQGVRLHPHAGFAYPAMTRSLLDLQSKLHIRFQQVLDERFAFCNKYINSRAIYLYFLLFFYLTHNLSYAVFFITFKFFYLFQVIQNE